MTDSKKKIELKTGSHWKWDKSVLCSDFFTPDGCPIVDARMLNEHISAVDNFLEEDQLSFLMDLSSSENVLSFDALKRWGQSEVLNKHRLAEAYVVDSLADLIFLKQHIRLNSLKYPARVFQSLTLAKQWLERISNTHHIPMNIKKKKIKQEE